MKSATRRAVESAAGIRDASCDLFYRKGFQAATLRQIASRVGLQVSSLYNHIESKGDLLFEIMETTMIDLLTEQRAVAGTPDVVERLGLLVRHHVRFHVSRSKEVFIGNSELRSLKPKQMDRSVGLRREYECLFEQTVQAGIAAGRFVPTDVPVAVYGILAMTSGVASWYSRRGRLLPDQIADTYAGLVVQGLSGATKRQACASQGGLPEQVLKQPRSVGSHAAKIVLDKR